MRIRKSGSSGGQKGLQSIIENLDSEAFPRIRIGIGKKPDDYEMADWVLSKITDDDMEKMTKIFDAASEAVELLTDGKIDEAMGKYNGFTAE
jgi:PTH1 family peptidyl-tRNA hydrolase